LDDDILIKDGTVVEKMKKVLESDDEIGLVSGILKNEISGDFYVSEKYVKGLVFKPQNKILFRYPSPGEIHEADGVLFRYADQVPNFFLARRKVFDDVKWDNRIKVEYEHMDFFLTLKKADWKAAVCLDAEAIHMQSKLDVEYLQYRRSAVPSYFLEKWDFTSVVNRF